MQGALSRLKAPPAASRRPVEVPPQPVSDAPAPLAGETPERVTKVRSAKPPICCAPGRLGAGRHVQIPRSLEVVGRRFRRGASDPGLRHSGGLTGGREACFSHAGRARVCSPPRVGHPAPPNRAAPDRSAERGARQRHGLSRRAGHRRRRWRSVPASGPRATFRCSSDLYRSFRDSLTRERGGGTYLSKEAFGEPLEPLFQEMVGDVPTSRPARACRRSAGRAGRRPAR